MRISDWSSDVCSSDLAVLKQLCYFIAYAVEQPTFITDSCYIDVERTGEALLGNPLLESLQDHLVFLHDCHAADPLIVCDCLIIGSDEANNIFVVAFFQDFYADMPIKQPIAIPFPFYSYHNRRLDNANLADRRSTLPAFNHLFNPVRRA